MQLLSVLQIYTFFLIVKHFFVDEIHTYVYFNILYSILSTHRQSRNIIHKQQPVRF